MRTKTRSFLIAAPLVMVAMGFPTDFHSYGQDPPPPPGDVTSCRLERGSSGKYRLILDGTFQEGSTVSVGGVVPRKVKVSDPDPILGLVTIVLKGRICSGLPGNIVVTRPSHAPGQPFFCARQCLD